MNGARHPALDPSPIRSLFFFAAILLNSTSFALYFCLFFIFMWLVCQHSHCKGRTVHAVSMSCFLTSTEQLSNRNCTRTTAADTTSVTTAIVCAHDRYVIMRDCHFVMSYPSFSVALFLLLNLAYFPKFGHRLIRPVLLVWSVNSKLKIMEQLALH